VARKKSLGLREDFIFYYGFGFGSSIVITVVGYLTFSPIGIVGTFMSILFLRSLVALSRIGVRDDFI
jgi:hypothetical protein